MWLLTQIALLMSISGVTSGLETNNLLKEPSKVKAALDLSRVVSYCNARECLKDFGTSSSMIVFMNSTSQIH